MIDENGYAKLTDFGLSTLGSEMARSICGTMNYIAPEVLFGHEYSYEVDYWSLGCLVFEMVSGHPPFWANNQQLLKKTIGQGGFTFPADIKATEECKSFIQSLLVVKVQNRLGFNGIQEIFEHPWLNHFSWDLIEKKELVCPLKIQNLKNDSFVKGWTEQLSMDIDYNVEGFTWNARV